MGRILLHAGMHKTGTSSIQASLSSGLSDPGFIYLDLGEPNHSGPLINLFGIKPESYHGNRKRGLSIQDLQTIRQSLRSNFDNQLKSLGERTAIISAEDACRFSIQELTLIRDSIASHGHQVEVVIYIRPPRGYIESAFQQLIKGGQSSFQLENAYPHYRNLVLFSEVFDKDNCSYRIFSRAHLHQGDVLLDLLHKLKPGLMPTKQAVVNEGISLTALKFLYVYRKHGPGYGADKDAIRRNNGLVGRLARLKGGKLRLDTKLTDKYFERSKNDLAIVASLLSSADYQVFLEEAMSVEANVHCEDDLLRFSPKEVEELVELSKILRVTIPEDYESYTNPQAVAEIVARLMPAGDQPKRVEDIPTVIKGKEGYLFLAGGRHSPYAYAKGQLQVNPKSIQTFWRNIRLRRDQMRNRKIAYLHLVVPDKHNICKEVFPEALPFSLYSEYINGLPEDSASLVNSVIYPLHPLKSKFRETCSQVDTHLTPLGYVNCLQEINSSLEITKQRELYKKHSNESLISLMGSFVVAQKGWPGDLGSKLDPPQTQTRMKLKDIDTIYFFSNRFTNGNNGICDIHINTALDDTSPVVLIFGDSFGRSLARVIARVAKEVVFCRTPFLHVDIVNQFRPTHVISQNIERYLSSVVMDQERPLFWLYPLLKGEPYQPPLDFLHAVNALSARDRQPYYHFIKSLNNS